MPLRQALVGHEVTAAYERGWSTLKNAEFLQSAESAGFAVLVTTGTNLRYQQNLANRRSQSNFAITTTLDVVPPALDALLSRRRSVA